MNYSATATDRRAELLRTLGHAVRARRTELGITRKGLAERAGVSERFLSQLEGGEGNISVARLQDVAEALGTTASQLLATDPGSPAAPHRVIALLGLRGAGKSTLGPEVARRLGMPFFELDALVAREAGMPLPTIFELHGDSGFRRLEHEALRKFLDTHQSAVLATSGAIVTHAGTYEMLRKRATTVWLRAKPQDHWDRVLRQGDARPMRDRANAMSELKAILKARRPLYALADHAIDTSTTSLDEAAGRVVSSVAETKRSRER